VRYPSWQRGVEAYFQLLDGYYRDFVDRDDLEGLIATYAPVEDNNDPVAYARSVRQLMAQYTGSQGGPKGNNAPVARPAEPPGGVTTPPAPPAAHPPVYNPDGTIWDPNAPAAAAPGGSISAPVAYAIPQSGLSPAQSTQAPPVYPGTPPADDSAPVGYAPSAGATAETARWSRPGDYDGQQTIYYDPATNQSYPLVWDSDEPNQSGGVGAWVVMPDPFARDTAPEGPGRTIYDPPVGDDSPIRKFPDGKFRVWDGSAWVTTGDDAAQGGGGGGYTGGGGGGGGGRGDFAAGASSFRPEPIRFWADLEESDQQLLQRYFATRNSAARPIAEAIARRLGVSLSRLQILYDLAAQWTYRPTAPVRVNWRA
jgi:hypothetical protein